jgi:hypothetical protein
MAERFEAGVAERSQATGMAVGRVGCELVSAGDSLFNRERTGNLAHLGHREGQLGRDSSADPVGWKGIPYGLEQGIFSSEQGTPGGEQGIDTPCSPFAHELDELRRSPENVPRWRHRRTAARRLRRDTCRTNTENEGADPGLQSQDSRRVHAAIRGCAESLRTCRM